MASIRITIQTDGAAFHGDRDDSAFLRAEVAHILAVLCGDFARDTITYIPHPLKEHSGNVCGKMEVIE